MFHHCFITFPFDDFANVGKRNRKDPKNVLGTWMRWALIISFCHFCVVRTHPEKSRTPCVYHIQERVCFDACSACRVQS